MSEKVYEKLDVLCQLSGGNEIHEFIVIEENMSWVDYFHLTDILYTALRVKGLTVEFKFNPKNNDIVVRPLGEHLAPLVMGQGGEHTSDPYIMIHAKWLSDELIDLVTAEMQTFRSRHLTNN